MLEQRPCGCDPHTNHASPMLRLDLSRDDPAANLAIDETLLVSAEQGGEEVLRFWQFSRPVVVIGRGSKIRDEVDIDFCESRSISIMRRCSGGAAIVAGPGCWLYSVVLDLVLRPELRNVDLAHQFVMGHLAAATKMQRPEIQLEGICDLTYGAKKFSGNSLRVAKDHLLYHGTILMAVDLPLVSGCLRTPPRQPDYRVERSHEEFITAIEIDSADLSDCLAARLGATQPMTSLPDREILAGFESKYASKDWIWRH